MTDLRLMIKGMVPGWTKDFYRKIRKNVISFEFKLFRLWPIKQNRVVFCNVWGYGDNPKWVAEALLNPEIRKKENTEIEPEIIFITDTSRKQSIPDGIKVVKNNTPAAVRALATARIWLDCNRKEPYISKRKGQYYIQTWHGSLPLKKIEKDCEEEFTEEYSKNAIRDTEMTDLYISNSNFCNDIYRRAFGYGGRIFVCGSPRVDVLINEMPAEKKQQIRQKITDKELIAVYAPTFRGDGERFKGSCDGSKIVKAMEEMSGKSVCVVKRLHPLCLTKAGSGEGLEFSDKDSVNGNDLGDLYELLAVADVLITDYSNTMFEFAYSRKPVFLYAPDYQEYSGTRGMYFDYESLPFPVCADIDALSEAIRGYDREYYLSKQNEFFKGFDIVEKGNASEKVARIILRKMNDRNSKKQ